MNVIQSLKARKITAPIYGGSADVAIGSLLMPGVTAETDDGVLIANTTASNADCIGILNELHDYSASGDALVNGTRPWFSIYSGNTQKPSREVELCDAATLVRVDYTTGDTMAIGSMPSTTTVRVASIEDNIDTCFLYVVSGTGIGQTAFVTVDDGTDLTLYSAPTVGWVAGDTLIKILPLYHRLIKWTAPTATAPTYIGTDAAAGTGRGLIVQTHIVRNGLDELMDPVDHHNLQSLNSLAQLGFYAIVHIQDTGFHPID